MDNTPDWDSLSTSPPQAAPVPQDTSTPDAAASASVDDWANQQLALGVPESQIEAQMATKLRAAGLQDVKKAPDDNAVPNWDDLSKTPPKAAKAAPLSWDDLTPTPPSDSDITREQQQQAAGYSVPNYSPQVTLSPISRDIGSQNVPGTDVPVAPTAQQNEALAGDSAYAGPTDTRRDVGGLEGFWRGANQVAAGVEGVVQGGAAFLGYPITAADAALSGRQVPSLTDAVVNAEQPAQQAKQAYAINPQAEKLTLAGQVGEGAGQAGANLLTMASGMGEAGAASEGVGLAERLATRLYHTAKVASLPAASQAQDAAQNVIDSGGTPDQALSAAASAYQSFVVSNLLPVSVKGGAITRSASGAAIGASQAAASGGDLQSITAGAITGAGVGLGMGERGEPALSPSEKASANVSDYAGRLADQNDVDAINAGVEMAKAAEPAPSDVAETAPDVAAEATAEYNHDDVQENLRVERDGYISDNEDRSLSGLPQIRNQLHDAVIDAVNSASLPYDNAAPIVDIALENGRLDLAEYAVTRAENDARSLSVTPGVAEGSPKYAAIQNDLIARKSAAQEGAAALRQKLDEFKQSHPNSEDTQTGNESTQNGNERTQSEYTAPPAETLQSAADEPSDQPKGLTPETISAYARGHIAQLESQDSLTPVDEHDLAFLRQNVDNPQAIADHYNIPLSEPSQGTLFARSDESEAPDTYGIELQDLTPEQEAELRTKLDAQQQLLQDNETAQAISEPQDAFVRRIWRNLAAKDAIYQNPRIDDTVLNDAISHAGIGATKTGIMQESDENGPYTAHYFKTNKGNPFVVKEYPDALQVNVSDLKQGDRGSAIYNAVSGLAKSTGKVFQGDTQGLSDTGVLRRTDNMMSAALKYGAENVAPHERQQMPGGAVTWAAPLRWKVGNDDFNTSALIKTQAENVSRLLPEIKDWKYNFGSNRFEKGDGSPVTSSDYERMQALAGDRSPENGRGVGRRGNAAVEPREGESLASQAPYGVASIKRAVVTRSLAAATDTAGRRAALDSVRAKLPEHLNDILYARGDEGPNSGITPEQAKAQFAKQLSPLEARKLSAKIGMASSADVDNVATELSPEQRAGVRGFTTNGKPHVVLDHVTPDTVVPVAAHEAIHANLQRIIGELGVRRVAGAIRKLAASHPEIQEAIDRIPHDTPAEDMDQEVVAHAGEHLFDTSLKTRLLDGVKLGLNRMGFGRKWIDANEALIRGMTRENLRHYALSDESPSFNVNGQRVGTDPLYQRVFHGTPHRGIENEGFKLNKIGTGEGAQAYGWGMYFAGLKDVADAYRPRNYEAEQEMLRQYNRAERQRDYESAELWEGAMMHLHPNDIRSGDAFEHLPQSKRDAVANELTSIYKRHQKGGQLYHAEIPEDKDLLDWDKPLSEQTEGVRKALASIPGDYAKASAEVASGERARDVAMKYGMNPLDLMINSGGGFYDHLANSLGGPRQASEALNAAGIPGLRYFDGGSRNAGEGTHNYVIWDEKHLNNDVTPYYSRTQYAAGDGDSPFAQKLRDAMAERRNGYTTEDKAGGTTGEPVGVKNAYKAQEREARGLGELDAEGRRTFGNVWDTASEKLQSDPGYGARLTADVATKSRPISAEETASLIQYGAGLKNRYEQALRDHDAAIKSGDGMAALGAKIRAKELEDLLGAHDQASRNAGYEQALGLSARRLMANRDYSLATQMMRFRAIEGGEVPQKVQAKVKEYAAKIADLQKQLDEQRAQNAQRQAAGYRRPASVAPKQHFEALRAKFANLAQAQPAGVRFAREDDMRAIVRGMAHSLVEDGETNAQRLVDRVHSALAEYGAQRGDVARTIAGIGERAAPTKTELQLRLAAIKKELRAEFANPEAKRNAMRQTQLRKQMDDIKRRISTGDFSKVTRQPIKYNEDTLGLEDERNKLQRKMDGLAIQRQRANASPSEKLADFVVRLHRGLILTGVNTLGKLSWAALSRIALTPTEELIGSGLRQIPGISQIAAKAPREGAGFSLAAERAALSHTLNRQEILSTLLHGEDSLARQYSNKAEYPFDWLNLAGHIHGMIKEPAKLNEFYRGFQQRAQFERNRVIAEGMTPAQADAHMQKPSTQATLGAQAFIDAKRAIFQNDTQATKLVAMVKHGLRTAGADGDAGRALGIAAEKAIGFVMPIVKVPVNFAAELGSYAAGGAKAALALRHGIDALTPDQADYVMRNLKKQTVGAALMTVGMLAGPSVFGGFYQTGDAKKHRSVKAEEANIPALGGHFNRLWFDSPALDSMQVGATLRRIYDQEAHRYGKPSAVGDAIYHAVGGMVEKVPFLDEPRRIFESLGTPKGAQKYLAGAARDTVIPLAVQQYAAHQDNDTARKTKTPAQVFQRGLPQTPLNPQFNREHLPRY